MAAQESRKKAGLILKICTTIAQGSRCQRARRGTSGVPASALWQGFTRCASPVLLPRSPIFSLPAGQRQTNGRQFAARRGLRRSPPSPRGLIWYHISQGDRTKAPPAPQGWGERASRGFGITPRSPPLPPGLGGRGGLSCLENIG